MAMIASLAPWANKTELVAEEVRKHGQCIDELQRKTHKLTCCVQKVPTCLRKYNFGMNYKIIDLQASFTKLCNDLSAEVASRK